MTDRPIIFSAAMVRALLDGRKTQTRRLATSPLRKCEPGDRLYVREAFTVVPRTAYAMSEGVEQTLRPNDDHDAAIYAVGWDRSKPKWRPSIHMPRWASRLTLIVEAVRVEPLQAISEADAGAEGVAVTYGEPFDEYGASAQRRYELLWRHLHGADSWAENPSVVALTFRILRGNIDRIQP